MPDYNIEFSHIYLNELFAPEHYKSARLFLDFSKSLIDQKKTFSSNILIDDYNPSEMILDVEGFLKELKSIGAKPDFVVYEASLIEYGPWLLGEMNGNLKRKYTRYIDSKGKYPCSFLLATWHLIRLGELSNNETLRKFGTNFTGDKLMTILPHRYGGVEKRALDIISVTKFHDKAEDIEYIYF